MPLTLAQKTKRARLRQSGELPPVPLCPDCGRRVVGTLTLPRCALCWRKTPAGREACAAQRRQQRLRNGLRTVAPNG
jgi:hypothetical protein